jgi:hypothetical protein
MYENKATYPLVAGMLLKTKVVNSGKGERRWWHTTLRPFSPPNVDGSSEVKLF